VSEEPMHPPVPHGTAVGFRLYHDYEGGQACGCAAADAEWLALLGVEGEQEPEKDRSDRAGARERNNLKMRLLTKMSEVTDVVGRAVISQHTMSDDGQCVSCSQNGVIQRWPCLTVITVFQAAGVRV
jgi:hypothetical protein